MAATMAVPVRMRVGDLAEVEIGTISPVVGSAPDVARSLGNVHVCDVRVDFAGPLAELLRAVADSLTAQAQTAGSALTVDPAVRRVATADVESALSSDA
jgi:hypothetical protein